VGDVELKSAGQALVDGGGTGRVVTAIQPPPLDVGALRLTPGAASDRGRLFSWANDPEVRARAFDSRPIGWRGHVQWWAARLASADCRAFIGWLGDDQPVGPVRFDRLADGGWEITVALAPEHRGRGLSAPLISAGCDRLAQLEGPGVRVRARIRADNVASRRAFARAGFGAPAPAKLRGVDAVACWWTPSGAGAG
jgi:RimJ/RimL family protein N-acetyltransferase